MLTREFLNKHLAEWVKGYVLPEDQAVVLRSIHVLLDTDPDIIRRLEDDFLSWTAVREIAMGVDRPAFVLLEGRHGNQFFTTYVPGEDPTTLYDGTVAYKVLGYAHTVAEAQQKLGLMP